MDKRQILKISKHFKVSEKEILNALKESEAPYKNTNFGRLKNNFLLVVNNRLHKKLLKDWLNTCTNFNEVEEIFVYVEGISEETLVIRHWLKFCETTKQAKEVFMSSPKDRLLLSEIIRTWINLSNNLEDVREANKYTEQGSDENKLAIKKIIKFY